MNLIWLHCLELRVPSPRAEESTRHLCRLIAALLRPVARQRRLAEAERKRLQEESERCFADGVAYVEKQKARSELHRLSNQKSTNCNSAGDLPELIDPDLDEEVDWRLRFSETTCLSAMAHMNAQLVNFGLTREDQIMLVCSAL